MTNELCTISIGDGDVKNYNFLKFSQGLSISE